MFLAPESEEKKFHMPWGTTNIYLNMKFQFPLNFISQ